MEELVALCKRRGFIFQSAEIYGGLQGVYDFGPLGVELKNNLKSAWWKSMVYENDNIEGLDASILTNSIVLDYSGHTETFSDPMVDCKSCGLRFRESMFAVLPPISPYNNIPVFVPMDVRNRNMQNYVNYQRFFDNVTSDGLMGKYNINQVIPKHHDLRNKDNLDRLLKIESELSNNMSRGEKYYRHKRGFFNMF